MKRIVLALVVFVTLFGCGHKDNSNENNQAQPKVSDSQPSKEVDLPPQLAEEILPSESEDYLEGYSGVVVSTHPISEKPRVGSGIAMMIGGSLLTAAGYATHRSVNQFFKIYTAMNPETLEKINQLRPHKNLWYYSEMGDETGRLLRRVGYGKNPTAREETLVRKLLRNTSAKNLALKRGASKAALWGSRAAMIGGMALTGWGIAEFVLEPTELGDGEPSPADRFENVKHSVYTLAADPENTEKQDRLIQDVLVYLPDVINALKLEYNTHLGELETLKAQGEEVKTEDLQQAEKEFEEYAKEHRKVIDFFELNLDALRKISEAEETDREKAQEILNTTLEELNKIYGRKEEKKEKGEVKVESVPSYPTYPTIRGGGDIRHYVK